MNPVPEDFRNIICPWQTKREIASQCKTAIKVLKKLSPERRSEFLGFHVPDREWGVSSRPNQ